jgi:hypothetical protein
MREKPLVLTVLDSYIQPNRGEIGCDAVTRAKETEEALKVLGCEGARLGFRDDSIDEELIGNRLWGYVDYDVIYVPALQGGNPHHDMVSRVATIVFGDKVIYYPTYTKSELWTEGETEVVPTEAELALKEAALACYVSQITLPATKPHFDAVWGKSEWLGQPQSVYLGAGKHHMDGWLHLDYYPFQNTDVVCDVIKGLPFKDSSISRIYSQDFLEHLPQESKIPVMNELWRVLKPGGTMEHVVPQAGSQNDFGSPSHISHWNQQQFEHFDVNSYRYEKDRDYEGFKGGFEKVLSELAPNGQTFHVIYKTVK